MNDHDEIAGRPAARFNASDVTETIRRALASAGLDTRSGVARGVTDTIEQALSAAGLMQRRDASAPRGVTIDGTAREVFSGAPRISPPPGAAAGSEDSGETYNVYTATPTSPSSERRPRAPAESACDPGAEIPEAGPGEFVERSFVNASGARVYKVFVPSRYVASSEPMPMLVMLHGCTQSPDDFAAGTRMNALADEHGFVVVYPAQCASANPQKCWNWFRTEDQVRESGEPAIIAGITREVASTYRIDERRIFVAGMSAGAAMAVILGATYPDLYAAVGAHSGLAYGVAHDMASAFSAMHSRSGPSRAPRQATTVPAIVFHGDGDHTVDPRNATAIVEQVTAHVDATLRSDETTGVAAGGAKYRRTRYTDASNRVVAELWTLHGVGHAWSGGSAAGSFTERRGPDASKEMIRFFYSLPLAGTA